MDYRVEPMKKHDLQFKYPTGPSEGDDPSKRGVPDRILLNRDEWYEVLYFCNRTSNGSLGTAKKSERLIKKHLPGNVRSQDNVLEWLQNNWEKYD